MAAAKPKGKTPKKKVSTLDRNIQNYTRSGAYNKTDGKLRKVQGDFALKLAADTFTQAAGYTEEYAAMARANPGMAGLSQSLKGIGTYDPATMSITAAEKVKREKYLRDTAKTTDAVTSAAASSSATSAAATAAGKAAPWENTDLAGGGIPLTAEDLAAGPTSGAKKKKKGKPGKRKNPRGRNSQGGKPKGVSKAKPKPRPKRK